MPRKDEHPHQRLNDGECLTHAGWIVWTEGDDEVGFRRLLAPVFAFVIETRHDSVSGAEVKQDGGKRKIQGVVAALGFEPFFVQWWSVNRVGDAVQFQGRFDQLLQRRFSRYRKGIQGL